MNENSTTNAQPVRDEKYHALFEYMTQGAFWKRADGTFEDINPAAMRMFGLSREAFINRTSLSPEWDIIREDGSPCPASEFPSVVALSAGRPVIGVVLGIRNERSGSRVWVEINAVPEFREGESAPFRVMVTMHDITSRKLAEQALGEREAFYHDIFERNQAVKLLIEPKTGRIVEANRAACAFYGYSHDEITALRIWDINTLGETETRSQMKRARSGDQMVFEFQHRLASGEIRDVQVYSGEVMLDGQTLLHSIILDVTQRKEAERTLQDYRLKLEQNNQILSGVLEYTHALACLLDTEFNFLWVNRAYALSCGYPTNYFPGKNHFHLYPHEENEAIFRKVLETGEPCYVYAKPFEYPDQPQRGTTYWDWSLIPLRGPDERISGLVFTLTEVTARIRQEKELLLQSLVLDQIRDQVTVTDLEGVITYVNQAEVRMFQRPREALIGHNIAEYGEDPERGATQRGILETTLREGEWRGEVVNYDAEGREHIMDCRTRMVHDEKGEPVALCGIATDITERKETEEILRANDQNLRSLFEAIHESVSLYDCTGKLVAVNTVFAKRLGRTVDQCVGEYLYNLVPPEVAAHRRPYIVSVLETGKPVEFIDERQGRWLHHRTCPVFGPDGSVTHFATYTTDITERRAAEQALSASEEQFRQIVERSNDVFYRQRISTGRFEYVSPKIQALIGLTPDEMCAMDLEAQKRRLHPEDLPGLTGFVEDLIEWDHRGLGGIEREFRLLNSSGEYRWIHGNYSLIRDAEGNPDLVVGCLSDITERRSADEERRRGEQRFRTLIENASDILVVMNKEGVQTYVSDSVERITGFSAEECTNRLGFEFVHPEDRNRVLDVFGRITATPEAVEQGEYRHRTKSGGWVYLEAIGKNWLHDPDIGGIVLSVRDITERKKADAALRTSETRYRELVEYANSIIIRMDREGRVTFANEYALRFFGYSAQELIGREAVGSIAPEVDTQGRDLRGMILDIGRNPERYRLNENENMLSDGSRVWISWSNNVLLDSEGNFTEILSIGNDMTARKQAEVERIRLQEQLAYSRKMESVGRLAGGVAHDFNNMLSVILGMAEMALDRISPEDAVYAELKEIEKAANRSADLTRQLLAFARRQSVAPEVLDLNEAVSSTIKLVTHLIGEGIDLKWTPGENVRPVKVDRTQLDQILTNLCINARDAVGDVGKVWVETRNVTFDPVLGDESEDLEYSRSYVKLSVRDSGCGMSPETVSQIFDPFFTTKKDGKGTGLGLATVYGAVQQNDGVIKVQSAPGQGSTFVVYLPAHILSLIHI